jgi:toxin ParE1/3/4
MPIAKRSRSARVRLKVVWTEYALRDLERIDSYIARSSPAAAARWVGKLIATAASLASAPMSGRAVPEKGRRDIREVLQRHYRIVYRLRESRIDILTVFEGHKQLPPNAVPDDDR